MLRGLRKWTPRDKYFKYQNFLADFRLSLFLECFGEICRNISQPINPVNLLKVVVFPLNSNATIFFLFFSVFFIFELNIALLY